MMRKFINRKEETEFLERQYKEEGLQVIVIYGRRRVGKTEIIKEFMKDKQHIYFLADKRGTLINAKEFATKAAEFFNDISPEVKNFENVFKYIVKRINERRMEKIVIAIDEFSYLVEKDDSIPSIFQKIIDEYISNEEIFLILNGSSISMMEKGVLSYSSPLYGRRTGQWKVTPLSFFDSGYFLPKYNRESFIEAFSVCGNIPAYLLQFDDSINVYENIKEKILKKGSFLNEEIAMCLKEELREPSTYFSILFAIANGATRVVEIADKTFMNPKDLSKYLETLQRLSLVKKEYPITEKKVQSKKTLYFIDDNFFRFWFRFVYPNKSDVEIGNTENIMKKISLEFNTYVGKIYEEICREVLIKKRALRETNINFNEVGRWWGHYRENGQRKEVEIDLVAINEDTNANKREIYFFECKWKDVDEQEATGIINNLKEKAKFVEWNNENRTEKFGIFAKKIEGKENLKEFFAFDLEDF
ncbi:MAG: hypothetical protein CVT88_03215 [Candidatus Altiarchaeales archaeon HGW-Altiarchaeales-1]|nr:MAG: hypothetical protein CVT88_03215 [Candidatus Altiarchaeales archaeon HGW-Altiarchaeales-1]